MVLHCGLSGGGRTQRGLSFAAMSSSHLDCTVHPLIDVSLADVRDDLRTNREIVNPVSLKRFAQFLRDTARIDDEQAQELLDFLKRERRS